MAENYGRKAAAWLPTIRIQGIENPVIEVIREKDDELIHIQRITGSEYQPGVFETGSFTVRISEPESGKTKELKSLSALARNDETVEVEV